MNAQAERWLLPGAQATMDAGAALASSLVPGCVVWLLGDLGAGKTTLARGLIQHFDPGARVKSPTYSLIETYSVAPLTLHHLDLYRVRHPDELEALGLREVGEDVVLIEWPGKGGDSTPPADLELTLWHTESEQRALGIVEKTERGRQISAQLRQYLERTGYE